MTFLNICKNKFPSLFCLGLLFLCCAMLLSSVSGGVTQDTKLPSVEFVQLKETERQSPNVAQKPERSWRNNARTLNMMDSIFDSLGLNSITWVPGLRSLMDMNTNGTNMEFVPLGRLIWQRIFGDSAANTLLGL